MDQPSFLDKLKMNPSQLWEEHKVFLIVFGLLILVIKFQDVIFGFLVKNSKNLTQETQKKSDSLRVQEDDANAKANQLIKEAKETGDNRKDVDENWNLKK